MGSGRVVGNSWKLVDRPVVRAVGRQIKGTGRQINRGHWVVETRGNW